MEDASVSLRDGGDGEGREADVTEGSTAAADSNSHHRGSADKFNTLGYERRTRQKVVSDFVTVSKGSSGSIKPRAALRQVLFSQAPADRNQTPEERGQLDLLKQDLEAYPIPVSLKWRWNEENQGTTLEKNWTDIVRSHSTMSKLQRHQQEALWEFVHTELTYINKLIVIKDLVIAALVNLHQRGFLQEVTPERLFSNLPWVLSAHQLFWQEVIYPMLQEVRTTGRAFDPMMLEAGCLQFHERFSAYQQYCWEEESNLEFARRQMESNPHFLTYIQWVETHPYCERMRLGDMQVKPHQRITKYPLLLKAVLKDTEDPEVQHALRSMLSTVKSFLESINDYLRLKDEELALSISAQRVEGYEVEGINEETDKFVKEICPFDLTCPIRGVGPGVVRKLLLEENLKIRGRKDSKLEVVALLFSDVLLMTKAQKKGEKLKVVRPPLALDRTYCMALKDGCSFVLVEVGELWCAMNVYIFAASTSESCSTWVSTIHQAKETLRNLRETENNRHLERSPQIQIHPPEEKPVMEDKSDDLDVIKLTSAPSEVEALVDDAADELIIPQSINGVGVGKDSELNETLNETTSDPVTNNAGFPFRKSQLHNNSRTLRRKRLVGWQQAVQDYEWIEMMQRRGQRQTEEEERRLHTLMQKAQSSPDLMDEVVCGREVAPVLRSSTGPRSLIPGGYPDVDYPTDEQSSSQLPLLTTTNESSGVVKPPEGERRESTSQPRSGKDSGHMPSEDTEIFQEAWSFSKNLKSPALRKRRPFSNHHGSFLQTSQPELQSSGKTWSSNRLSPDSYSEDKRNINNDSGRSSDSHRVLKLGSLKPNQGMFWVMNDDDGVSPHPQTLSEPHLPSRRPEVRTQRSASTPNIIMPSGRLYISAQNPNRPTSSLEGLLERARGRRRDQDRDTTGDNGKSRFLPPSPSFSTTPSPPPSDGDKDTEWEEEVQLLRHRALSVSKGWREQLVDGDEDDKGNSVFVNGVNVDWSGWCFDDEEVLNHLQPGSEGLLEGISQCLSFWNLCDLLEQEEGAISQV